MLSTWAPEMDPNITLAEFFNDTLDPLPGNATSPKVMSQMQTLLIIVKVAYAIGIVGNAAAIITLRLGERRVRNRKHLLLLTSLAANDLVALVGMVSALLVAEHFPDVARTQGYCAARVVLRIFGIGSVCIVVTMALERYLALTRPFVYQKQVTYFMIRMALLVSWIWAALLACAPVIGIGIYYDADSQRCIRYRNATEGLDFAYAIFYVTFGIALCMILVYCNLAVMRALYAISTPREGGPVVRRVSKRSCRSRCDAALHQHNAATAEEVTFSRLMATLSVIFMICWLPQMVTSALYLTMGKTSWPRLDSLGPPSDMLMLLNYVLNPIIYVLMRQRRRCSFTNLGRSLARCFKRNHKTSTESMKTSCCPQETIVMSDSSGAEMRPLRAPPCAIIFNVDD
ncbi:prostaglandin E2 receptor EP2 subtype [Pieris napi]|uniref:prostaglandin E2 receptor EP2 subtype n=1 Tax=Pieris napi TaxID=78633 RepID=UPI001FBAC199|nr:prostaglandin E2 receptor EP2 subtype [Pieris napi]